MSNQPHQSPQRSIFTVRPYLAERFSWLRRPLAWLADRILGFASLTARYHAIAPAADAAEFTDLALAELGVSTVVNADDLALIPREGACIVVANHPHGGLDGLIMMQLLLRVRPDVKFLANHFLSLFGELETLFFQVNPFGGNKAVRYNIGAARAAVSWLQSGGMLVVFPGGEVSSLDMQKRRVMDPAWDNGVARLVEQSHAPVLPVFIGGRNSNLFQLCGLIHPRLRTALLVREMLNARDRRIPIRIGRDVAPSILAELAGRHEVTRYLRTKTYLLAAKDKQQIALNSMSEEASHVEAIVTPVDSDLMAAEVARLPANQWLISSGAHHVYYAKADQIPWLLQEIGRLRELSFRAVGEGTGKKADLDLYDVYYLHLFVWDADARQIVGGYRIGHADRILDTFGPKGLYIHSLFKLSAKLTQDLRYALEVGRSFVSPVYQKNYSSLMLLWKGIAMYAGRDPRYRILFGPVSISNDYHPVSKEILVQFLKHHNQERRRASHVKPRRPFRITGKVVNDLVDLDQIDLHIMSDLLGAVEQDDKGVPVLLRQYLKLGGQILGFNIDPQFANSIDCLLWVDLMNMEYPLLQKYMGKETAAEFHAYHKQKGESWSAVS